MLTWILYFSLGIVSKKWWFFSVTNGDIDKNLVKNVKQEPPDEKAVTMDTRTCLSVTEKGLFRAEQII